MERVALPVFKHGLACAAAAQRLQKEGLSTTLENALANAAILEIL
jgi:hypothetical protein